MVSDEELAQAVAVSQSVLGVLRLLGKPLTSGNNQKRYSDRIKQLGLDTSHFSRGAPLGVKRKGTAFITPTLTPAEILVFNRNHGRRESPAILLRALLNAGEPYHCRLCAQLPEWHGVPLRLEVDHINGNPVDNRRPNLRFLCPNCHSQQPILRPSQAERSRASRMNKILAAQSAAAAKMQRPKQERRGPSRTHQHLPFVRSRTERIELLMNSHIDFHLFGWATEASVLLGITPQKVVTWMRKWMPDFYAERCFKKRQSEPSVARAAPITAAQ